MIFRIEYGEKDLFPEFQRSMNEVYVDLADFRKAIEDLNNRDPESTIDISKWRESVNKFL